VQVGFGRLATLSLMRRSSALLHWRKWSHATSATAGSMSLTAFARGSRLLTTSRRKPAIFRRSQLGGLQRA
jgi:hypothetical protein